MGRGKGYIIRTKEIVCNAFNIIIVNTSIYIKASKYFFLDSWTNPTLLVFFLLTLEQNIFIIIKYIYNNEQLCSTLNINDI